MINVQARSKKIKELRRKKKEKKKKFGFFFGCTGLINYSQVKTKTKKKKLKKTRGHPGSNRGPLDLQSNALPLSYIPNWKLVLQYVAITAAALPPRGR